MGVISTGGLNPEGPERAGVMGCIASGSAAWSVNMPFTLPDPLDCKLACTRVNMKTALEYHEVMVIDWPIAISTSATSLRTVPFSPGRTGRQGGDFARGYI